MLKHPALRSLGKIWRLLDRGDRWQLVGMGILMLIGTILEALGVGLVLPFIAIIEKPSRLNDLLFWRHSAVPLTPQEEYQWLLILSISFAILFIGKNLFIVGSNYLQSRFLNEKELKFSMMLLRSYLFKPYTFHLQNNTAKLVQNASSETINIFTGYVLPLLIIISESLIVFAIFTVIILSNPFISLVVIAVLAILSYFFFRFFRRKLKEIGAKRVHYAQKVVQSINQGLGGIKEVKILGREQVFLDVYEENLIEDRKAHYFLIFINQLPRSYFETLAVIIIILIIILILVQQGSVAQVLPLISLFAAAAFRLLPSATRLMVSLNSVIFYSASLDIIYDDLLEARSLEIHQAEPVTIKPFRDRLELIDLHYTYPNAPRLALCGVSLTIKKGEMVGFVGASGAGKTTIVDLILGLLEPSQGDIRVDGESIYQNLPQWQRQIGYIPQTIYLSDDTLRRNIAFGLPDEAIDETAVWAAVEAAQLSTFVRTLPEGLDTVVGERGVRLSGGQRQRVGIARALYHNPSVLIMDEATAALDNQTEAGVMDAIQALSGEKTIIMIAHRLSTVMACDRLYLMANGQVAAVGSYQELLQTSPDFRAMAQGYAGAN
ncbi:MAG TPA: ABC transporter ATP-binding protein [Thermosynechococcus sp. M98_K2018_005]|uniref:ABC transporter ATP-binding protein n=1 Tax=Thermosynechococcus sp. M98_K2018_005 TaxID=2747811 RepID=UPI001A0FF311|nr:ABC transporter ATP-binding protein [Thermosynechococcus sp. M98_K2018_005]HIK35075.1 ABC transporter ATP-binding protein [Thermosynechococcus sp. M98_K2018_005]